MDAAQTLEGYTIADIYNLPEGQRAELMNGKMYMMAPPNTRHQELVHFLDKTIGNYIDSENGDCKIFPAPFGVFLNESDAEYVEPDISVICDKSKIDEDGCKGAPDWVIEIVSPASRSRDYGIKLFKYRAAGVREYWIVDSDKDRITVWSFEQDIMEEYSFCNSVKAGIYDGFEIDFSKLDIH